MKEKTVIFGAQGLLGNDLFAHFSESREVIPLARFNADLSSPSAIFRLLDTLKPETVINAAAISDVDFCEEYPEENRAINTVAPEKMAEWCAKNTARFVQISTDFVFDGETGNSDESTPKNPINAYGKAKALAEDRVQEICPKTIIARTARLYGEGGENFAKWVFWRAKRNRELPVIDDEFGNYTFTKDFSIALEEVLDHHDHGIFHLMGKTSGSPQDFAEKIVALLHSSSPILPISGNSLQRQALRPKNTTLVTKCAPLLRGFEEALPDFLKC